MTQPSRVSVMLFVALTTALAVALVARDAAGFTYEAIVELDGLRCIQISVVYFPFVLLLYGSVQFQLGDYGEFRRRRRHVPAQRREIERLYDRELSDLLILVPSYKEDAEVIRRTLLSSALLEYPRRRVVLLIDDPPFPSIREDVEKLAAARAIPRELQQLLAEPAARLEQELAEFLEREQQKRIDWTSEMDRVTQGYEYAAAWLETQASAFSSELGGWDHSGHLFLDQILLAPAQAHRHRAAELRKTTPPLWQIAREYRRLAALFQVEFSSFERKRYANLSHAVNKAMNLNSYLALIGKSFIEVERSDGVYLQPCSEGEGVLRVPAVDYVITLDADTVLLPDYALRLVHIMEQPGNERLGVVQTPYSAFPGAPVLLERIAGATTDVQFLNHQGMTYFDAASWVGANALLRRSALEDIAVETDERGHRIKVFIQDKTVVEDTGSTIDLIARGWKLYNYQERLAYSATPPDFGALLIQRRRWSNGGLILLPNLLRYIFRDPISRLREGFMRAYYLVSTCIVSVGLLIVILYRFDDSMVSVWLPLAASPYQLLYGSDLRLAGYRWADLPRVYALNMLLIPVHLGGTLQSVKQIMTGRKAAFSRTPKVAGRTSMPLHYIIGEYGLVFYCVYSTAADALDSRYYHMLFSALNSVAFFYGVIRFIGLRNSLEDLLANLPSLRGAAERSWLATRLRPASRFMNTAVPRPAMHTVTQKTSMTQLDRVTLRPDRP